MEKNNLCNTRGRCKATCGKTRATCKFNLPGQAGCAYLAKDNETCLSVIAKVAAMASIPALPEIIEVAA